MDTFVSIIIAIAVIVSAIGKISKAAQKQQTASAPAKPRTYTATTRVAPSQPAATKPVDLIAANNPLAADPERMQSRLGDTDGISMEYSGGIVHPLELSQLTSAQNQHRPMAGVHASQVHDMFTDRNRLVEGIIFSEIFASRGGRGNRMAGRR